MRRAPVGASCRAVIALVQLLPCRRAGNAYLEGIVHVQMPGMAAAHSSRRAAPPQKYPPRVRACHSSSTYDARMQSVLTWLDTMLVMVCNCAWAMGMPAWLPAMQ